MEMEISSVEHQTLLENLDECLQDRNEIVTFDWFSESFGIHVNASKNLLDEYYKEHNKNGTISRTCCVGGTDNGELKIFVVPEDKLFNITSQLEKKLFEHTYSIQKTGVDDVQTIYTQEYGKFKENMEACGKFSSIKINSTAPVKSTPYSNGNMDVKEPVELSTGESASKKAVSQAFSSKTTRVEQKVEVKKEPLTELKSKPAKFGAAGSLSNMFARQQSRPKAEIKEEIKQEPVAVEIKAEAVAEEDDFCEERTKPKSSGSSLTKKGAKSDNKSSKKRTFDDTKVKKQKEPAKKLRRIRQFSDSSESELESEESERAGSPMQVDPPVAELLDSDEEPKTQPAKPSTMGTNTRKRTMKLVNKQYMDEEGFLITKKEYEACSESDEEEKEPDAQKKEKETSAKETAKPAASKQPVQRLQSPPVKKKQSTISSFFTRK